MKSKKLISVVIPISERNDDILELHADYKSALVKTEYPYEIIYVIDGEFTHELEQLSHIADVKVIKLAKSFGEATALSIGFENSKGDLILTLPAYYQVEPSELPKLVEAASSNDMVIASRYPRTDSIVNRIMAKVFHSLLNFIAKSSFKDLGCGVRLFKRKIIEEIAVYGEQHRFLPILALGRGFSVKELDLKQSTKETYRRIYRVGIYVNRLLDILTILFLVKFTKKPLRFFGLIGTTMFVCGGALFAYPVLERLFFDIAMADRPILVISALMIVLGVQVFALGLIGELVIFTHAKNTKEYNIEKIIEKTN